MISKRWRSLVDIDQPNDIYIPYKVSWLLSVYNVRCVRIHCYPEQTRAWVAMCSRGYIVLKRAEPSGGSCRHILQLSMDRCDLAQPLIKYSTLSSNVIESLMESLIRIPLLFVTTTGGISNWPWTFAFWNFQPLFVLLTFSLAQTFEGRFSAQESRMAVCAPTDSESKHIVAYSQGTYMFQLPFAQILLMFLIFQSTAH